MTQRICSLVCLLLVVFHFQTSFAQDADELSLDSEMEAALDAPLDSQPAPDLAPENVDPMDSIVDTQSTAPDSADPFDTMMAAQNVGQTENVNLATPLELRQREGALFGFSAGLVMSSQALQEKYDVANLSGGVPISTDRINRQTNSIQHVGVMLRYAITPFYKLGTDLNVSYSKSQNHNSITVKDTQTLGEITTLKGELNLAYAIEMGAVPVYFLAGFGAEKVSGNEVEKLINSNGVGGQIGGGFVINSTINVEAIYAYYIHRISNAMLEGFGPNIPKSIDTEEAQVINQGLLLRGSFSFNF